MDELVARFGDEAGERTAAIERLHQSLTPADNPGAVCGEIREHAHKLKGAAGVLGFTAINESAAALEQAAQAATGVGDVPELIESLRPHVDGLKAAVSSDQSA